MKYYFVIISLIGLSKCEKVPLIIKGDVANIREFSHSAFLFARCTETQGYMCGSSIVSQRILLTAAHCVVACNGKPKMAITVGHSNFNKGLVYGVHSARRHEEYNARKLENDIALIRLSKDLKFSVNVRRVALLKQPPYFEKAKVAGWGKTEKNKESEILLYIDQYVWKKTQCKKSIRILPQGSFCASSKKYNSTTNYGDSGSALIVKGYIQIGVFSFKVSPVSSLTSIYTDVGYHYDWIRKNSKKLYCL